MDDPLSAVDASVGKKMMDEAICGVLQGKCRILATHQLHVLDRVDRIIYMADGKIDAIGTYDELRTTNRGFMDMLAATSSHDDKEKEEEDEEVAIETTKPKMSRANTKASVHEKEALMQEEERQTNSIKWTVYKEYFQASGTIWNVPMLAILVSLAQGWFDCLHLRYIILIIRSFTTTGHAMAFVVVGRSL
jgi:ATP-binding cassette subfamily C (CFTR/MRP) protein 1